MLRVHSWAELCRGNRPIINEQIEKFRESEKKREENGKEANHKLSRKSPEADPAASGRRTFWTAPSDGAVSTPIGSKPIIGLVPPPRSKLFATNKRSRRSCKYPIRSEPNGTRKCSIQRQERAKGKMGDVIQWKAELQKKQYSQRIDFQKSK